MPIAGDMYRLTVKGKTLPNLYRFVRAEPRHCQLHGDYLGVSWLFQKRRNSEARPWGGLRSYDAEDDDLQIENVSR